MILSIWCVLQCSFLYVFSEFSTNQACCGKVTVPLFWDTTFTGTHFIWAATFPSELLLSYMANTDLGFHERLFGAWDLAWLPVFTIHGMTMYISFFLREDCCCYLSSKSSSSCYHMREIQGARYSSVLRLFLLIGLLLCLVTGTLVVHLPVLVRMWHRVYSTQNSSESLNDDTGDSLFFPCLVFWMENGQPQMLFYFSNKLTLNVTEKPSDAILFGVFGASSSVSWWLGWKGILHWTQGIRVSCGSVLWSTLHAPSWNKAYTVLLRLFILSKQQLFHPEYLDLIVFFLITVTFNFKI